MRTLIASMVIWIFVVPGAVALILIVTPLMPKMYFVFMGLALALASWAMTWQGPWVCAATPKLFRRVFKQSLSASLGRENKHDNDHNVEAAS